MKLPGIVHRRRFSTALLSVIAFVLGITVTHAVVMAIDHLSYKYFLPTQQYEHFPHGLWSPVMLPMMGAYGFLSVALYLMSRKLRQVQARSHEQELRLAQQRTRVETAQRLTGLVVETVGRENVVIGDWIHRSTQRGKSVSPRLVEATGNIGKALQALSRVSFELPYRDNQSLRSTDEVEESYKELMDESS